eukprot:7022652-Pyramimonas_sp.AAC.1
MGPGATARAAHQRAQRLIAQVAGARPAGRLRSHVPRGFRSEQGRPRPQSACSCPRAARPGC